MKKAYVVIVILVAIALVAGGIWWFLSNEDQPAIPSEDTTISETTEESIEEMVQTEDATPQQITTITYTNNGFDPESLTVKSGTVVTIKNDSSGMLEFSSDPHPSHTSNNELNTASINPGQSVTITADKVGTWGFHNHLDHTATGVLIVE